MTAIILMGVSGSGKTTIGRKLAEKLHWPFVEGDDCHPAANVEKMAKGIPLEDADRWPWLASVRRVMEAYAARDEPVVISCSALKQSYRDYLAAAGGDVCFVYLKGSPNLLRARLARRCGHYMPVHLLSSQLETLEEPANAITVDAAPEPEVVAEEIIRRWLVGSG